MRRRASQTYDGLTDAEEAGRGAVHGAVRGERRNDIYIYGNGTSTSTRARTETGPLSTIYRSLVRRSARAHLAHRQSPIEAECRVWQSRKQALYAYAYVLCMPACIGPGRLALCTTQHSRTTQTQTQGHNFLNLESCSESQLRSSTSTLSAITTLP